MFNKATDAVSKMTIKMNESDIVSSIRLSDAPRSPEISEMTFLSIKKTNNKNSP